MGTIAITLYAPKEKHALIKSAAALKGMTLSEFMVEAAYKAALKVK